MKPVLNQIPSIAPGQIYKTTGEFTLSSFVHPSLVLVTGVYHKEINYRYISGYKSSKIYTRNIDNFLKSVILVSDKERIIPSS